MNSVDRVKEICKERKIAISKLEKACGFANGYIGQLRKGVFPDDRLKKIAAYLEIDPVYLMSGDEKEKPATISGDGQLGDIDLSSATDRQRELIRRILGWSDIQVDALLSVTQSPPANQ